MISICIPIFNCNVRKLVEELNDQCKLTGIPFEILLIDDASENEVKHTNRQIFLDENIKLIELEKNIGRAAIRNLFLKYSKYQYLLFIDCDSDIPDDKFLLKYIDEINLKAEVVCGGRIYPEKVEDKRKQLHLKYGAKRECLTAATRKTKAYHSFLSNNFLIQKAIFEKCHFDERITKYGHEDTLFGYNLKLWDIKIKHIDNPLIHYQLENSSEFLIKTQLALENLYFICSQLKPEADFKKSVKILRTFSFFNKFYCRRIISMVFNVLKPIIKYLMLNVGINWLILLDFYKLGYFCQYSVMKNNKK